MYGYRMGKAGHGLRVFMFVRLSSDHFSPATGKTVAVTISKNGAAFANPQAGATSATEVSDGWYYVDLSATDAEEIGALVVRGTAASCDDAAVLVDTPDPTDVPNVRLADAVTHGGSTAQLVLNKVSVFKEDGVAVDIGVGTGAGTSAAVNLWRSDGAGPAVRVGVGFSDGSSVATGTAMKLSGGLSSGYGLMASGGTYSIKCSNDIEPPAQAAGRPTGVLGFIRRLFEWASNKKTRNRSTGDKKLFGTDGTTVLETQVQSTVGSTDQETQGS